MKEYTNSQIRDIITEHVHDARDRGILADRFIDGLTIEKLAEKYELDPRTIRRHLYKLEERLFKYL